MMMTNSGGRPREFDREAALRGAACLFWRHGFSGTSTRMLTGTLGISSSSLYAAFGSKAELFDEAVRTYALRYSAIYERAVSEPTLSKVVERVLTESVREFYRTAEGHPGCLTSSAVMADAPASLDIRAFVKNLQQEDEQRLFDRMDRAMKDGELARTIDIRALVDIVQTVWLGLSVRADSGDCLDKLLTVAELTANMIEKQFIRENS